MASSVGAEEFGAFSFVTVLYIVALGGLAVVERRTVHDPLHGPGRNSFRAPARRSLGATCLFGTTAGVACVLAAALAAEPYRAPLLVLGAILPFLLLQDSAGVMSFTMFRMRAAAANDGLWAGLLVLALGGLARFVDPSAAGVGLSGRLGGHRRGGRSPPAPPSPARARPAASPPPT